MCWKTKDIIYRRLNDWQHPAPDFPQDLVLNFQNWTNVDTLLYEFFKRLLLTRIKKLGQDFKSELKMFKYHKTSMEKFCKVTLLRNRTSSLLHFKATKWNPGYAITYRDCNLLYAEDHLRKAVKDVYDNLVDSVPHIQQPPAPNPGFSFC